MKKILSLLKNKLFIIPAIFVILVVIILWMWLWTSQLSGILELSVAPASSRITLNGQTITNGTHHISPGKYALKVEKDGFESKSQDFEIKAKETKRIILALKQTSGDNWYEEHEEDDIIRSGAGYQNITNKMDILKNNSPIASSLPYTDVLKSRFTISYETNSDQTKIEKIKISVNTCINSASGMDSIEFRKKSATTWLESKLADSEKDKYIIEFIEIGCVL